MNPHISMNVTHLVGVVISIVILLIANCDAQCPFSTCSRHEATSTSRVEAGRTAGATSCVHLREAPSSCDAHSKYRTPDGTCNNLKNRAWGASFTPMERLFEANYADGRGELSRGVDGTGLPNARSVSMNVNGDLPICSENYLNMVFIMMCQFVAHDIVNSHVDFEANCTSNSNPNACAPIPIPCNDEFYRKFRVTVLPLRRFTTPCYNGTFDKTKPRISVNTETPTIDLSQCYGSNKEDSDSVRTFEDGKMKMDANFKHLMPFDNSRGFVTFKSADFRADQQPLLSVLTSMWIEFHNLICNLLKSKNHGWDDERLFQEAKRITTGVYVIIVYQTILKFVLGPDLWSKAGLALPSCPWQHTTYNSAVNPSILMEASCAAYRLHSGIQNNLLIYGKPNAQLKDNFLQAGLLASSPNAITDLLKGALNQCAWRVDKYVAVAVTRHALQFGGAQYGFDLAAINTRRGEDCGLLSYVQLRKALGLHTPHDFLGLSALWLDPIDYLKFVHLYKGNALDLHAWQGMMRELHMPGALVGVTQGLITAEQFNKLKDGDRHFVTHGGQASSFTKCQLQVMRKFSLAHVICFVYKEFGSVQLNALQLDIPLFSPRLDCSKVHFDITPWQEVNGAYRNDCKLSGC